MSFRRNRTFVVAWLIALLVALAALALPTAGVAAEPGAISGTVTGEGAGALAGIEVCAEQTSGEAFPCEVTDSSGEYELPDLPPGQYRVEFWPIEVNWVRQFYSGQESRETASPVTVVAGATTLNVDATLEKGAKINGIVTAAATGQPVSGVFACAFSASALSGGCDETDSTGHYSIIGLRGGQYEVEFFPEDTTLDVVEMPYSLGPVTVPAKGEANGINQALVAGGQIAGTVRLAATGAPLGGVRVCVTEAETLESFGCVTTSTSGAYRFTGTWRGSFKIVFSAEAKEIEDQHPVVDAFPTQWWNGASTFATATPIAITPPAIVTGIDAALGPPPAPVLAPPAVVAPVKPVPKAIKPKPLNCRKGLIRRKVHGKAKCVRLHKTAKHKRHHKKR